MKSNFYALKQKLTANDNQIESQGFNATALFGSHAKGDLRIVDHFTDFANALGALGTALRVIENGLGRGGTSSDRVVNLAFADSVTIADVHNIILIMRMRLM